jgi:hypothetical protein
MICPFRLKECVDDYNDKYVKNKECDKNDCALWVKVNETGGIKAYEACAFSITARMDIMSNLMYKRVNKL